MFVTSDHDVDLVNHVPSARETSSYLPHWNFCNSHLSHFWATGRASTRTFFACNFHLSRSRRASHPSNTRASHLRRRNRRHDHPCQCALLAVFASHSLTRKNKWVSRYWNPWLFQADCQPVGVFITEISVVFATVSVRTRVAIPSTIFVLVTLVGQRPLLYHSSFSLLSSCTPLLLCLIQKCSANMRCMPSIIRA